VEWTTRLWRVDDPGRIERVREALREARLLIADGHHRYETAVTFREEDGADSMMVVLVGQDEDGLVILPDAPALGHAARRRSGPTARRPASGAAAGTRPLPNGRYSVVDHQAGTDPEAVAELDAEVVGYTPLASEAVAAVDRGEAEAAFLLRPVTVDEVRAVAERGEVMPQKSTYFYPKLLSGLLFHPV